MLNTVSPFALVLVLLLPSITNSQEVDLQSASQTVVAKTNEFRKEQELPAVKLDKSLQMTAQKFADFMAENGKYGHHADGRTPAERATASGYDYCVVRENIAYRTDTRELTADFLADHFTQGWIDSPGHRENMLAEFVTDTAVAIATKDGTTFYAVHCSGGPQRCPLR